MSVKLKNFTGTLISETEAASILKLSVAKFRSSVFVYNNGKIYMQVGKRGRIYIKEALKPWYKEILSKKKKVKK